MEKCKIIVNLISGRGDKLSESSLRDAFSEFSSELYYVATDKDCTPCENISAVCGGDGTLNHAINSGGYDKLYYVPSGTLNETASFRDEITSLGIIDGKKFSYVAAAGTFTNIGYSTKPSQHTKKRIGYLKSVLKAYKVHNIEASVKADKLFVEGEFTLIMLLKSPCCFKFKFNKLYDKTKQPLYVLLIRSPRPPFAPVKLFLSFFRVFVVGIKKPILSQNIIFTHTNSATLSLASPRDFCLDGEKYSFAGVLDISSETVDPPITIVRPRKI